MKITTYNPDGSILKEEDYKIDIPQHIQHFDPDHSFINITDEEMELINSKEESFGKTILLDRLVFLFQHDYENYLHSVSISNDSTININNVIGACKNLNESEMALTKFLKHCSHKKQLPSTADSITKEDISLLSEESWIETLFFHSDISAYSNKKCDSHELATAIAWLNLLQRYYYALTHYDSLYGLPYELTRQLLILKPFANINKVGSNISNKAVVSSLYGIKEQRRSDLYRILAISQMAKNTVESGMMSFEELSIEPEKKKEYIFTLDNCDRRPVRRFKLSEDEISSFRIKTSEIFTTLQLWLSEIYTEYCRVNKKQIANQVETDAEMFFKSKNCLDSTWHAFYVSKIKDIKDKVAVTTNKYAPELCFYSIIVNNISPDENISFSEDLIYDLFDTLSVNQKNSQQSLYRGMCYINYVKEKIRLENYHKLQGIDNSASRLAISKALTYIEPLFSSEHALIGGAKVKQIMADLLSLPEYRGEIVKNRPNGFNGGFNLILTYNFLGLLSNIYIVSSKSTEIDKEICKKNIERGLVDKMVERKHYIIDYKSTGSFIKKDINRLIEYIKKYQI